MVKYTSAAVERSSLGTKNSNKHGEPSETKVTGPMTVAAAALFVIVWFAVICEYPNSTSPPLAVMT
jgi:hypothetical protein